MSKCVCIKVFGKVQGVGFRYSSWLRARKLRLNGFVRNEPDGSVSVLVQGEPPAVDEFIAWAGQGPVFSKVKGMDILEQPIRELSDFRIIHH